MTAPTKMALVPAEATEEMIRAARSATKWGRGEWGDKQPDQPMYAAMISASPSSGRLTAADLERAAEAHYAQGSIYERQMGFGHISPWADLHETTREKHRNCQRAAFAAIGLQVEGEGA